MVVLGEPMSSWGSHWHPYKLMIFNVCEIWNKVIISLLNTIPFNTSPQHRWWSTNVILDVLIDDLPLVSRVPVSPNPISRLELSQLWTIQSPVGGNSPSNVYTSLKYKNTYKMKSRQLKTQTQESQTQREYNAISCHQVHSISTLLLSDIARVLSSEHIVSSLNVIWNYMTFLYKYKYNYQYNSYICTNTLYYYVCLPGGA